MIAVDLSVKTPVEKPEQPMEYKGVVSSPKEEKGFPLERQIAGGK